MQASIRTRLRGLSRRKATALATAVSLLGMGALFLTTGGACTPGPNTACVSVSFTQSASLIGVVPSLTLNAYNGPPTTIWASYQGASGPTEQQFYEAFSNDSGGYSLLLGPTGDNFTSASANTTPVPDSDVTIGDTVNSNANANQTLHGASGGGNSLYSTAAPSTGPSTLTTSAPHDANLPISALFTSSWASANPGGVAETVNSGYDSYIEEWTLTANQNVASGTYSQQFQYVLQNH